MANQEHLTRLQQGVDVWNTWREEHPETETSLSDANLRGARLIGARLIGADLIGADLSDANLRGADLRGADLSRANLRGAHLIGADLSRADLIGADLRGAHLIGADLRGANLSRANLSRANLIGAHLSRAHLNDAVIGNTQFGDRDFREMVGLETIEHRGPSPLSINSLYLSEGHIPEAFVRGTGAPDTFIEYMRALTAKPIEYYTCFISYSSKNQDFAERLYTDLQANGVRCWYAPEDMKIGDVIRQRIDDSIHIYDKLLLILSLEALCSTWVESEVEAAFEKERRMKRAVLFPVRIDDMIDAALGAWAAEIRRTRHIGDFSHWKDYDAYQKGLKRLLRDLKQGKPGE
jgi:hypothetical protein